MSPAPVDGVNREVELYVRSLAPTAAHERQEEIVSCLERLDSQGHISGFDVHIWGKHVDSASAVARTETGRFVRDRIERFKTWAERTGWSTATFFDEKPIRSRITGEEYTAMVLPTVTLAEYIDGELAFVAPCSDGDTVHTIEARLEAIADDSVEDSAEENSESPRQLTSSGSN